MINKAAPQEMAAQAAWQRLLEQHARAAVDRAAELEDDLPGMIARLRLSDGREAAAAEVAAKARLRDRRGEERRAEDEFLPRK